MTGLKIGLDLFFFGFLATLLCLGVLCACIPLIRNGTIDVGVANVIVWTTIAVMAIAILSFLSAGFVCCSAPAHMGLRKWGVAASTLMILNGGVSLLATHEIVGSGGRILLGALGTAGLICFALMLRRVATALGETKVAERSAFAVWAIGLGQALVSDEAVFLLLDLPTVAPALMVGLGSLILGTFYTLLATRGTRRAVS